MRSILQIPAVQLPTPIEEAALHSAQYVAAASQTPLSFAQTGLVGGSLYLAKSRLRNTSVSSRRAWRCWYAVPEAMYFSHG